MSDKDKKDGHKDHLRPIGRLQRPETKVVETKLQPIDEIRAQAMEAMAITSTTKILQAGKLMEQAQSIDDSQPENWPKIEKLLRQAANLVSNDSDAIHPELKQAQFDIQTSYKEFCIEIANIYLNDPQIGNPHNAIKYYNKARSIDPNDPVTHMDLGTAYIQASNLMKAMEHWQAAIDRFDENIPEDRENIALICENLQMLQIELDDNSDKE